MARSEHSRGKTFSDLRARLAGALAGAAVATLSAAPAVAAILVTPAQSFHYEESLVLRNADFDGAKEYESRNPRFGQTPTLLFDGFDSSLGTLQTVRVLMDSTQEISGGVSVARPRGASSAIAILRPSYDSSLSVWGTTFGSFYGSVWGGRELPPACYVPREACVDIVTSERDFDVDMKTAALSPFQRGDVQVELGYLISSPLELQWLTPNPTVTFLTQFQWSGTVQLIYDYTPPGAVPEPASWAMAILGFGVVGMSMRRRRREQALA